MTRPPDTAGTTTPGAGQPPNTNTNTNTKTPTSGAITAPEFLAVSGQVLVEGVPAKGSVQVVVHDGNHKYLASRVSELDGNGRFNETKLMAADAKKELIVAANFNGAILKGTSAEPVAGSTTRYVNIATPLESTKVMGILGSLLMLILLLIFLFTGELSRGKARALFAVTYFTTFLSLALPLAAAVLVSQNDYLIGKMKQASVGLVQGHIEENATANEWLVNIGGMPKSGSSTGLSQTPADPGAAAAAAAPATPPIDQNYDSYPSGLAVPFYIVMLAMLGAGINMTRQVPKVQAAYDEKIVPRRESMLLAVLHAPRQIFQTTVVTDPKEREAAAYIRKQLIDSYMYLLAAPFLAIAVYYLLQVVATNTAKPVLVLMAFSTGLISDSIVSRITDFAQNTIGKLSPSPDVKKPEAIAEQIAAAGETQHAQAQAAAATVTQAQAGESKPVGAAEPLVAAAPTTAGAPAEPQPAGSTTVVAASGAAVDMGRIEAAAEKIVSRIEGAAGQTDAEVPPAATEPLPGSRTPPASETPKQES
jgi:hypothetical protein